MKQNIDVDHKTCGSLITLDIQTLVTSALCFLN